MFDMKLLSSEKKSIIALTAFNQSHTEREAEI